MIKLKAAYRLRAYDSTWSDRAEKKIELKHHGEPKPQAFKDEAIFTLAPGAMAQRLKGIHGDDYSSAMSSISFHKNRAGKTMTPQDRDRLDKAKEELRKLYGKDKPSENQRSQTNPSTKPAVQHAPASPKRKPVGDDPIGSKPSGKIV